MRRFLFILQICMLLLIADNVSAREKRALAIGIGQYQDTSWGRINADNDLTYVLEILDMYRFSDVTILKNAEATKSAIVSEFEQLAARSGRGDVIYIHFSGHGQQMKDLDGDEKDGYDESWIPYDAFRKCCESDDGSMHLVDDEINALLDGLRQKVGDEGRILVVVDACHSGGSSRGAGEHEEFISRGVGDIFVPSAAPAPRNLASEEWVQISACEDYQVNFEVRKPKVGKLTYCLYKLRKRLPELSNDELMDELTDMMDSPEMISPMPQTPHFGEGKDRYDVMNVFWR